jgi:hypothetical protein
LILVVYRRSGTEVRPRSIWRGLELLALFQNAKYPWVILPILGVLIVETFLQECCNGYGHEKFYAGTIITSDYLILASEQFDLQRSSPLSTLYRLFFNICATGFRFWGPWGADGFYECQESKCLTKLCGKNFAIPALCFRLSDRGRGARTLWAGYKTQSARL